MPPGTGRGDGDRGSSMNPHIGYLETRIDGEKVIKSYLRTSTNGRKVRPNSLVDYDEVNYYKLVPISDPELAQIKAEESSGDLDKLAQRDAYIKVVKIENGTGGWLAGAGDYRAMQSRSWISRQFNRRDNDADG